MNMLISHLRQTIPLLITQKPPTQILVKMNRPEKVKGEGITLVRGSSLCITAMVIFKRFPCEWKRFLLRSSREVNLDTEKLQVDESNKANSNN